MILDALTVWQYMDIGALRAEFAVSLQSVSCGDGHGEDAKTYLGKVFTNALQPSTQVVAKGTGFAGLTGALTEEFARNVGCVC